MRKDVYNMVWQSILIIAVFVIISRIVIKRMSELNSDFRFYTQDINYFIDR